MSDRTIFQKKSLDYAEAPEQLDAYVKASGSGVWLVILALLILMITTVVWSVTGTLPETLEVKGCTGLDGNIYCYIPSEMNCMYLDGCRVSGTLPDGSIATGYVQRVSEQPYSKEELKQKLDSDWIAENLISSVYSYEVLIQTENQFQKNMLTSVVITVDEVKPIKFILN